MHREIGVPLAVPLLRIRESRVANRYAIHDFLFPERQRPQRLRQQLHLGRPHRDFAGASAEQRASDSDHVADVEQVERRIRLVAQLVFLEVELNAAAVVGQVREGRLAVRTPGHDAAGNAHRLALVLLALRAEARSRQRHGAFDRTNTRMA